SGAPAGAAPSSESVDLETGGLGMNDGRHHPLKDLPCRLGSGDIGPEAKLAIPVEHRHVAVGPHVDGPRALAVLHDNDLHVHSLQCARAIGRSARARHRARPSSSLKDWKSAFENMRALF